MNKRLLTLWVLLLIGMLLAACGGERPLNPQQPRQRQKRQRPLNNPPPNQPRLKPAARSSSSSSWAGPAPTPKTAAYKK